MKEQIAVPTLDASRSARIFWCIVPVFGLFLVLLPALFQPTHRMDNLHQLGIGREWIFGCYMFPGLSTWFAHLTWLATGGAEWSPYLTSAIFTCVSLWAIWQLGREYLSEAQALLGTLVMLAYWYFNAGSAVYSNYIPMTTFWLLAVLTFHYALKDNFLRYWVLTGVFLALSMWCKYPAFVLVVAIMIFMFLHPDARRHWSHAGPYLSILSAFLVFLPHTIYLVLNFSEMHAYIAGKKTTGEFSTFLMAMLNGWAQQLGVILPIFLALAPVLGFRPKLAQREKTGTFHDVFLPAMFLLPLAVQTGVQFASGVAFPLRSYGYQLWVLLGIFLLYVFQADITPRAWQRSRWLIVVLSVAILCSMPVLFVRTYYFSRKPSVRFFPAETLAEVVDEEWEEYVPGQPCQTISADDPWMLVWQAGVYSKFQPKINAPELGNWCSDEEARQRGGVVIWQWKPEDDRHRPPLRIRARFPEVFMVKTAELSYYQRNPAVPSLKIGVGLLLPPPATRNVSMLGTANL